MPEMTDEEYTMTYQQVVMLAGLIAEMNLPGFLERISLADSIGPILDPTLYLRASRNMHQIEEVARSLNECRRVILKIRQP